MKNIVWGERLSLVVASILLLPLLAAAQTGTVTVVEGSWDGTFCGTQAQPTATTFNLIIDGGTPRTVNPIAPPDGRCAAGTTHSFNVSPTLFAVGDHTVAVTTSRGGTSLTTGPSFKFTVQARPAGAFTIASIVGATVVTPPAQVVAWWERESPMESNTYELGVDAAIMQCAEGAGSATERSCGPVEVAAGTRTFKVRAVNKTGDKSEWSNEVKKFVGATGLVELRMAPATNAVQ